MIIVKKKREKDLRDLNFIKFKDGENLEIIPYKQINHKIHFVPNKKLRGRTVKGLHCDLFSFKSSCPICEFQHEQMMKDIERKVNRLIRINPSYLVKVPSKYSSVSYG